MSNYKNIDSALIHGGIYGDRFTGAVNVPIYQTSTYEQSGLGENKGWEYSRTGNPTRAALEALIAELEGGTHGFAFGSGMAAITAVLSLFKTGDKVIISSNVYGGTFRVLDKVFNLFGITYSIETTSDINMLDSNITAEITIAMALLPKRFVSLLIYIYLHIVIKRNRYQDRYHRLPLLVPDSDLLECSL